MKKIKKSDLSEVEIESLVKACKDVGGGPWPGIHYGGPGRVPMPATVTEADLWSDDRARTIGWTFHGPQGLAEVDLPVTLCDRIDGAEGAEKIRNASVRAHARNAIRKGEIVQAIKEKDPETAKHP